MQQQPDNHKPKEYSICFQEQKIVITILEKQRNISTMNSLENDKGQVGNTSVTTNWVSYYLRNPYVTKDQENKEVGKVYFANEDDE